MTEQLLLRVFSSVGMSLIAMFCFAACYFVAFERSDRTALVDYAYCLVYAVFGFVLSMMAFFNALGVMSS